MKHEPSPTRLVTRDLAAEEVDQALHQRQAEAHAVVVAAHRAVDLAELVEDERQLVRGNADPRVGHLEARRRRLGARGGRGW